MAYQDFANPARIRLSDKKEVKMEEITTVRLMRKTHERLGKAGYRNQTYDEVINCLLDLKDKYEPMEKHENGN